jgi:hypothetical protein
VEDAYQFALKAEEKLARKHRTSEEEVKARSQEKGRDLTVTEHINLRTRLRNHTITQNEEEVHEGDRVVEETLLEEEAEEE